MPERGAENAVCTQCRRMVLVIRSTVSAQPSSLDTGQLGGVATSQAGTPFGIRVLTTISARFAESSSLQFEHLCGPSTSRLDKIGNTITFLCDSFSMPLYLNNRTLSDYQIAPSNMSEIRTAWSSMFKDAECRSCSFCSRA